MLAIGKMSLKKENLILITKLIVKLKLKSEKNSEILKQKLG